MKKILNTYCALFFSFLALTFSGYNAFFEDTIFCITSGCHVLSDFNILGFSLWLYSFLFFVIINTLLVTKKEIIAFILLGLGLLADVALLVLMLFTAPCFSCLIIALIMAFSFLTLAYTRKLKSISYTILGIWALLFIINAGAMAKSFVSPYTIYINPDYKEDVYSSSMRIFFSPSCLACREAVNKLGSEEMTIQADIAWIPVPEHSQDIILIVQLERLIAKGLSLQDALEEVLLSPQQSSFDTLVPELIMQIKLLANQSLLNDRGTSRIPFVEYTGLPAHISSINFNDTKLEESTNQEINMLEILRKMSPYAEDTNNSSTNKNIGVGAFCDKSTDEDCE